MAWTEIALAMLGTGGATTAIGWIFTRRKVQSEASLISVQAAQGVNSMLLNEVKRISDNYVNLESKYDVVTKMQRDLAWAHEECERKLKYLTEQEEGRHA